MLICFYILVSFVLCVFTLFFFPIAKLISFRVLNEAVLWDLCWRWVIPWIFALLFYQVLKNIRNWAARKQILGLILFCHLGCVNLGGIPAWERCIFPSIQEQTQGFSWAWFCIPFSSSKDILYVGVEVDGTFASPINREISLCDPTSMKIIFY